MVDGLDDLRDEHARVVAENEALRERLRWHEMAAAGFPDYVTIIDRERRFVWCNRVHPRLTLDQVLGARLEDFTPDTAAREALLDALELCWREGTASVQTSAEVEGDRLHSETRMVRADDHAILVTRHVTDRVAARRKLEAELRDRELLLRELHHRMRNNLQLISSFLSLRLREQASPAQVVAGLRDRIQAMAAIQSRLLVEADFVDMELRTLVEPLLANLIVIHGAESVSTRLKLSPSDAAVSGALTVPIGQLLYELISNALHHAFPDDWDGERHLEITAHRDGNGDLSLSVADTGRGLGPAAGDEPAPHTGLGLVRALAHQLHADLRQLDGPGCTWQLSFAPFPDAHLWSAAGA